MKLFLICLLLAAALMATERFDVQRPDGSRLVAYIDMPDQESFPIAIVLQGSQATSVLPQHEELREPLLSRGFAIATLEKKGIAGPGEIHQKEYDESNSLDQRIDDHLLLISKLRKRAGWNHKLAIIGLSEGGEVGGAVAARTPETMAVLLFCSGGGWPRMEELLWSFRKQLVGEKCSAHSIQAALVQSKDEFYKALENPSPTLRALGFSYKYWSATLRHHLMDDLSKLHCPIYYVQGVQDNRIPVASADYLVKALKDKPDLVYRRIEHLGHDPRQDPQVFDDALSWLEQRSRKSYR